MLLKLLLSRVQELPATIAARPCCVATGSKPGNPTNEKHVSGFQSHVGPHFTFHVPANLKVGFDGLVVRCEVLECEPPIRLAFSWSAGGLVENTRVSFRLEPDGGGTRDLLEHSGFDLSQPFGEQALHGAEFGWAKMFNQLGAAVAGLTHDRK